MLINIIKCKFNVGSIGKVLFKDLMKVWKEYVVVDEKVNSDFLLECADAIAYYIVIVFLTVLQLHILVSIFLFSCSVI